MIELYATSEAAFEAHLTAWTCALTANAVDDYEPAIELVRHAVEREKLNQQYRVGLGAILWRTGRYEEAKDKLNQALAISIDTDISTVTSIYFLTMTEHYFGNTQAVQEHLQAAEEEPADAQAPTHLCRSVKTRGVVQHCRGIRGGADSIGLLTVRVRSNVPEQDSTDWNWKALYVIMRRQCH